MILVVYIISAINQFDNHGAGMNDNINNELRNVHNWLLAQRLSLNVSKTRLMMFYMPQKNVPSLKLSICHLNIEEVDHFNFLGLIIDKNMKWHTHVQKVANKIRNVNGILHKFKYVFPHRILILIYTSLIESHNNYCILLWGTNYDKIFKLLTADDSETANNLQDFFTSVFIDEDITNTPDIVNKQITAERHFIRPDDVLEEMKKLNEIKAPGIDKIHPKVLKRCCYTLSLPLSMLFNQSLCESRLPQIWKVANITPIHKKGPKSKAENYQPISLTSIPYKLLEELIKDHVISSKRGGAYYTQKHKL